MRVRLLLFIAVLLIAVVTLFLLLLATDTAMSGMATAQPGATVVTNKL